MKKPIPYHLVLGLVGWVWWFISRYLYIFRAMAMAFRSRRFGPSISEKDQFENRRIYARNPQPWKLHESYNKGHFSQQGLKRQEELGSVAFLVIKNDQILHEQYWSPFTKESVINSFSVAKSVVCILVGIAERKEILRLEDRVGKYLSPFNVGAKRKITIEHLLMMSSGLQWMESEGHPFSHNAEAYYGSDLTKLVEGLSCGRPPGQVYRYVSGNTQILAMVIREATGRTLSEFAEAELWSKIGASHHAHWNLDKKGGLEKAFCCLYAVPRDFARIGKLFIDKGRWNGQQIITEAFVERALTPTPIMDVWRNKPNDIYGLHWWLTDHGGHRFFYARGIRGQYVICHPESRLIIVRMGRNRDPVDRGSGHPPDLFDHIDAGLEIIQDLHFQ